MRVVSVQSPPLPFCTPTVPRDQLASHYLTNGVVPYYFQEDKFLEVCYTEFCTHLCAFIRNTCQAHLAHCHTCKACHVCRSADKSLARPRRKQARKHARDARDFKNIETRAVITFFPPARQGAEGNLRHSDRHIIFFSFWSG